MDKVSSSEITSKDNYLSRRNFIKRAAIIGGGALAGGGYLYNRVRTRGVQTEAANELVAAAFPEAGSLEDEFQADTTLHTCPSSCIIRHNGVPCAPSSYFT